MQRRNLKRTDGVTFKTQPSIVFTEIGPAQILGSAQFVCRQWWILSHDPRHWMRINFKYYFSREKTQKISLSAVDRGDGGLFVYAEEYYANDELSKLIAEVGGLPTGYRNVLTCVRKKLQVPCSGRLSTVDLEVQIHLHLLHEYSSQKNSSFHFPWDSNGLGKLEVGLSPWKVHTFAALKSGEKDVKQMIWKGSGIFTLGKMYQSALGDATCRCDETDGWHRLC